MVSAVQTPGALTRPPTTSTTRFNSPQWRRRLRRKRLGHLAPHMNHTSGLFGAFVGVSGKETGGSLSMVEGEPAFQLRSREHIVGGFTAMTCALVMVDFLRCPWLSYGNSLYARIAKTPHGQPGVCGGVASTDDGSALTIGLTARPRTRHSNDPVKCSRGQWRVRTLLRQRHHLRIPGQSEKVQGVGRPGKILYRWGGQFIGTAQGGYRGNVIDDKGVRRSMNLSCLFVPGLGRNGF